MSPSFKNFDEKLKNVFYALAALAETIYGFAALALQTSIHACQGCSAIVPDKLMGWADLLQAQGFCVSVRLILKTMVTYMKEGGLSSIFREDEDTLSNP